VAILLYCLTIADAAQVEVAHGICDSAVRTLQVGRVRIYISELIDPEACLRSGNSLRQAGVQFSQVLREVLALSTPIPFPFPALMESEEALENLVAAREPQYLAELQRLSGTVQYEITAIFESEQQTDTATPVKGSEYLQRRQAHSSRLSALDEKLRRVAGDSVRQWRARQERKTHHWFALVPSGQREKFLEQLRSAGPSEGVRLRLRGPLPPDEFVQLDTRADLRLEIPASG